MSLISQALSALDGGCAHGALGRAGLLCVFHRSTNLRTATTLSCSSEMVVALSGENTLTFKVTPNPPDTDPTSTSENSDSNDPIPSAADINATPRKLCSMFIVNPELDVETLLAHACESLASANVMALDLADHMQGTGRNSLLGIAQVIMLGELAVNRALDRIDRPE